jgi:nitrite reductase/ring-hydroxylating ferredoxin subunit
MRLADLTTRVEHARGLDRVAKPLSRAVPRLVPAAVRDVLHGVPAGHPLHPALTDVPVGAFSSVAVLDLVPGTARATRALLVVGIAGAVPTAASGLADWSQLFREQQRVGVVHAGANTLALGLYAASFAARTRGRHARGKALAYAGLGAMLGGAYLGGHLAFAQAAGASHAHAVPYVTPPGWHDVGPLDDLPEGRPVRRVIDTVPVLVLRRGARLWALADACSHLAGPLHEGELVEDGEAGCIRCPWHGSTFRIEDGSVVHGPATARQPTFSTRVAAGRAEVRVDPA